MGNLEALARLETLSRQFFTVLVLVLASEGTVLVLVWPRTGLSLSRGIKISRHITTQTISVINQANFDPEERQVIYADKKYSLLRLKFSRLFIPASTTPTESVFSQVGIIRTLHHER